MISKKILIHAGTTSLAAAAIVGTAMWLCSKPLPAVNNARCPSMAQQAETAPRPSAHAQAHPQLRAAPPVAHLRQRDNTELRTLDQRDRAADEALRQLHRAYTQTHARQAASRLTSAVTVRVAHQVTSGALVRAQATSNTPLD